MAVFDFIKDLGLKMAGTLTRRKSTDRVLVHHFAGNSTVQAVHEYHLSRGHKGIDYNIVVQRDGQVVWGRGLEYEGGSVSNSYSKTKGMNATSVAVALQGDYEHEPVPEVQWSALCALVRRLVTYYNLKGDATVIGHNEAAGANYTDCPGRYVDMNALRAAAFGTSASDDADGDEAYPVVPPSAVAPPSSAMVDMDLSWFDSHVLKVTTPYMRGGAARWTQQRLDHHLVDTGGIDGIFGPKTMAAVQKFQAARIAEGRDVGCAYCGNKPDGKVGPKTAAILAE